MKKGSTLASPRLQSIFMHFVQNLEMMSGMTSSIYSVEGVPCKYPQRVSF